MYNTYPKNTKKITLQAGFISSVINGREYMLTCNTQLIVCLCKNTIMFVLLNKKNCVKIIESHKWSALRK